MKPTAFPEFEDGQLREFLQHEIKQQKERNRRAIVLSVMIVVLVTVYMSFITYSVSSNFLNPSSAAQWLGYVAEENLPEYMDDTRRKLTLQAPEVADRLVTGVILNMPGYLSKRARDQVDSVVDRQLPVIHETMLDILSTRLAHAVTESDALEQIQRDPASAKAFADQLVAETTAHLEEELQQQNIRGVSDVMSSSLAALETINRQLVQPERNDTAAQLPGDQQRSLILSSLQIMEELMGKMDDGDQSRFTPGTLETF